MTRIHWPLNAGLLLVASFPAHASNPASLLTMLASVFFVTPWAVVNLVTVLRNKNRLKDPKIARRYTAIGLIGPVLGVAVLVFDFVRLGPGEPGARPNWVIAGSVLLAAFAIAFLPRYFRESSRGHA